MITQQRKTALSPPIARDFAFTRFQDQSLALAYQALIPIVSRPLGQPCSRRRDDEPALTTIRGRRSQARGA